MQSLKSKHCASTPARLSYEEFERSLDIQADRIHRLCEMIVCRPLELLGRLHCPVLNLDTRESDYQGGKQALA